MYRWINKIISGTLRFGKVDVTEAQFTIMAIHLISAFLGPSIWEIKVFFIQFFQFYQTILFDIRVISVLKIIQLFKLMYFSKRF